MNSNQILIGLSFYKSGENASKDLALLVAKDIPLNVLLESIGEGLKDPIYSDLKSIYDECVEQKVTVSDGKGKGDHSAVINSDKEPEVYPLISVTSYTESKRKSSTVPTVKSINWSYNNKHSEQQFQITTHESMALAEVTLSPKTYKSCINAHTPICDLGFVSSTTLIFSKDTEKHLMTEAFNLMALTDAFNPQKAGSVKYPMYNISTRQLNRHNQNPVVIAIPPEPPKKNETGAIMTLLPTVISISFIMLMRTLFSSGSGNTVSNSFYYITAATGLLMSIVSLIIQRYQYGKEVKKWKSQNEEYYSELVKRIIARKKEDAKALDDEYPCAPILMGITNSGGGIYELNDNLYSRSPTESDFLSFRLGVSDQVETLFPLEISNDMSPNSDAVFQYDLSMLKDKNKGRVADNHKNADIDKDKFLTFSLIKSAKSKHIYNTDNDSYIPEGNYTLTGYLPQLPNVLKRSLRYMKKAPYCISLRKYQMIGIVNASFAGHVDTQNQQSADTEQALSANSVKVIDEIIRRMIFDLCYHQSPDNLQFVIFDKNDSQERALYQSLMFMPHFNMLFPNKAQFAFNKNDADGVLGSLLKIVQEREKGSNEIQQLPHIVVIIREEYGLDSHTFAQYLPKALGNENRSPSSLGISFVYIADYKEYLPSYCDLTLDVKSSRLSESSELTSKITITSYWDKDKKAIVDLDKYTAQGTNKEKMIVPDNQCYRAFRFFSTICYVRIAQNGNVPSSADIFDLMNEQDDSVCARMDDYLQAYWHEVGGKRRCIDGTYKKVDVTKSLSIPIGKKENGNAYLDLHETKDGPHMLVAGTTGSGKSETILTFLLTLCMQFRPDEVNLLLVDMKGGGFTKRIGMLPHVVGSVTDVDGDETGTGSVYMLKRFLNSVQFEIKRRKLLLNEMYVDSVDEYRRVCLDIDKHCINVIKNMGGNPDENAKNKIKAKLHRIAKESPLPHLFIIVDEFSELKRFSSDNSDVDFISEITTIARVGRSLGIHIVLISQNIEGAITDDIRVNTKSKLCLKVATKQASIEMLGTDVAASPQMPGYGRAYLLVGNGGLEYFQSGYSGAGTGKKVLVQIEKMVDSGPNTVFFETKKESSDTQSQLSFIVNAIRNRYAQETDKLPIRQLFLPPLPHYIALSPEGQALTATSADSEWVPRTKNMEGK